MQSKLRKCNAAADHQNDWNVFSPSIWGASTSASPQRRYALRLLLRPPLFLEAASQGHWWQREHASPSLQPFFIQKYLQPSAQENGCPYVPTENSELWCNNISSGLGFSGSAYSASESISEGSKSCMIVEHITAEDATVTSASESPPMMGSSSYEGVLGVLVVGGVIPPLLDSHFGLPKKMICASGKHGITRGGATKALEAQKAGASPMFFQRRWV